MSAIEYFCEEGILLDIDTGSKSEALSTMVSAADAMGKLKRGKVDEVISGVLEREEVGSTGIGHGVAVPHARCAGVKELTGVFCRLKDPVDYNALDGNQVDLLFMMLSPSPSGGEHLSVLASVAIIARDEMYCNFLRQAGSAEDVYEILEEAFTKAGA